jgi:hypothetical protein
LRFLLSGGWAGDDAEIVRDLLELARSMAALIVGDDGASKEVRALAQDFLNQVSSETFEPPS